VTPFHHITYMTPFITFTLHYRGDSLLLITSDKYVSNLRLKYLSTPGLHYFYIRVLNLLRFASAFLSLCMTRKQVESNRET